ncbi:hypothetical protein DTO96_100087 [Ephemeroptericola cinctiostellae]|uniref:Zinc-finger domain-containing protein n=1 Tax=Ephemeroptericola cinctiostellae TaxID=2268024 RepID=A0A345D7P6_9BURK|nr:hypothetical protein [Ephemeroptericola cinctiostellae]AXF84384.1 hypothetical protein DTO96_100087 [Ephemeroptericola cinctiostellae]
MLIQCKDAAAWMVRLQDEQLPMTTRLVLRFHLLLCDRCRAFNQQMITLKRGVEAWREHID